MIWSLNKYANLNHPGMSLHCPILKYATYITHLGTYLYAVDLNMYANLHHQPMYLFVCCWFKYVCQLTSPRVVFELPHPKVCQLTSPTFLCDVDLKMYADLHHPGMSLHCPILKYANLHHPPICVLLIWTCMPTYITQGCLWIASS